MIVSQSSLILPSITPNSSIDLSLYLMHYSPYSNDDDNDDDDDDEYDDDDCSYYYDDDDEYNGGGGVLSLSHAILTCS